MNANQFMSQTDLVNSIWSIPHQIYQFQIYQFHFIPTPITDLEEVL